MTRVTWTVRGMVRKTHSEGAPADRSRRDRSRRCGDGFQPGRGGAPTNKGLCECRTRSEKDEKNIIEAGLHPRRAPDRHRDHGHPRRHRRVRRRQPDEQRERASRVRLKPTRFGLRRPYGRPQTRRSACATRSMASCRRWHRNVGPRSKPRPGGHADAATAPAWPRRQVRSRRRLETASATTKCS